MRAARLHDYHEGKLRLEDVPEPSVQGPFDVIVRIGGAGLCRTDLHILEGQWKERSGVTLPYVLGHENAGWVQEVGPAVTTLSVGDPVIVHPQVSCGFCEGCRDGQDMRCANATFPGLDVDGGFADLLRTSARSLVKLDPSLEPKDVAALADAGLTAYHAARKAAAVLRPGATAVVIGAGGLGHIGIQCLAALTPARIVVVDRSAEALDLATKLGAGYTVVADGGQVAAVRDLAAGRGAEVVMDFVGEATTPSEGIAMLRPGGTYLLVGYGGKLDIPAIELTSNEVSIVGNVVGTYNDLVELMALAAAGEVRLHTRTYPLEAINDAVADLDQGRLTGRGIIVPDGA